MAQKSALTENRQYLTGNIHKNSRHQRKIYTILSNHDIFISRERAYSMPIMEGWCCMTLILDFHVVIHSLSIAFALSLMITVSYAFASRRKKRKKRTKDKTSNGKKTFQKKKAYKR